ncbi:hypothetical protein GN157_14005 [Flavobacterium rakeshii]|uniref:MoxR-vWA-beta-propeller ternary system domain-containing protein n=1 Tax=Flavobacterium rakeshii TaxID=1038845 RepID=A0A6N8HGF4_9FLAO|nr:hypothetical protein [Flavobacterium rakeshii]MUV04827.1 hypothetical protein [Flavobacterium rakeshii]
MELKLKPSQGNKHPKRGVLVKGESPLVWLEGLKVVNLNLETVQVYPIPSGQANVLYGCIVLLNDAHELKDTGSASYCQLINNKLFIPQYSAIEPRLSEEEWQKLFGENYYFFHPETGLVELEEQVNWGAMLTLPPEREINIIKPFKGVEIPKLINSLSLEGNAEDLLKSLDDVEEDGIDNLPFNLKKIMKGNHREMDKLLKFLEKNPDMALKYGVPLSMAGTARGESGGIFTFGAGGGFSSGLSEMSRIGKYIVAFIISIILIVFIGSILESKGEKGFGGVYIILFMIIFGILRRLINSDSSASLGGGAAQIDNDRFRTLQQKYEELANQYINQKEYKKAAQVYLKLLKNNIKAAEVLEKGGYYAEAGVIYRDRSPQKAKAAECFVKGKMYTEALVIYKDLNMNEEAGDVYILLNKKEEANRYYTIVANDYKEKSMYVRASFIYRDKMQQPQLGQEILLEGWNTNKDAFNCLNNYLFNIEEDKDAVKAISNIYDKLEANQRQSFLNAIRLEYQKRENFKEDIRDIAYEVISKEMKTNPSIASELVDYNKQDKSIVKDVMKYKAQAKKRR